MDINSKNKNRIYILVLAVLIVLLIREYTYIHPYNPAFGLLGPRWTYISTRTFTWWFLLISSIIMLTPLFRNQKIGIIGLFFFGAVFIRPYIHYKFPEETAFEFYTNRKEKLALIIAENKRNNQLPEPKKVADLGFKSVVFEDSIFYFLIEDEEYPFGLCYSTSQNLPKQKFGRPLHYSKLAKNWYEFNH